MNLTHDAVAKFRQMPEAQQISIIQGLSMDEKRRLAKLIDEMVVNPYAKYINDPVGFIADTMGLDETIWGKQKEIAYSLVEYRRTACKASHSNGKTFLFGRLGVWWLVTRPLGEAMLLTTAPTNRQVEHILWKEIRQTHHRAFLKSKGFGDVLTKQWKYGANTIGLGASPSKHDESSFQGFHSPNLLILVDEAGGIPHLFGNALEGITTGANTKVALIGNPPTDEEGSWFQKQCESGLYNVISIPATSTPNFTGEKTGRCKTCSPESPEHLINDHLVDKKWVRDAIRTFGKDSNFVRARVYAKFPTSSSSKVLPSDWLESACLNENPVKGDSLEIGVDVAADGGDEFVIAVRDGWTGKIVHRSSGSENNNTILLGQTVLKWILACQKIHAQRDNKTRIRVKIDEIGVGRGLTDWLKLELSRKTHNAEIIGINVAESARDSQRFANKRAEMWWNMRDLIQPDSQGAQKAKLQLHRGEREDGTKIIDYEMLAQFAAPTYNSRSNGTIAIESKADMKKRLGRSPDSAEAMLLAFYNPTPKIDNIDTDNSSLNVNPVVDFSYANDLGAFDMGFNGEYSGGIL